MYEAKAAYSQNTIKSLCVYLNIYLSTLNKTLKCDTQGLSCRH